MMLEKPLESGWCPMPIYAADADATPTRMSPTTFEGPTAPTPPQGRVEPLHVMFLMGGMPGRELDELLAKLIRKLNPARFSPELCSLHELGTVGRDLAGRIPSSSHILRHRMDLPAIRRLAQQLKGRADALVTLGIDESMFWGCLAARWARVPVVLSVVPPATKGVPFAVRNRLVLPWSDGLIADREAQRRHLIERQGIPQRKIHVIARGVDTEQFCFQPAGAFAVRQRFAVPAGAPLCGLAAGRPSESAVQELLELARNVRRLSPQAHFLLLDAPPQGLGLQSLLTRVGLDNVVHVVESPAELPQAMSAINVLGFLADAQEPPVRVGQAMAVQAPVVATVESQLNALVQSDCTGYLVDTGGTHEFAARLVQLLNDPGLARRLGECARQHIVKHCSLELMVRRYEQLLCDMYLRKRTGQGPTKPQPLGDAVEFCGASP